MARFWSEFFTREEMSIQQFQKHLFGNDYRTENEESYCDTFLKFKTIVLGKYFTIPHKSIS